MGVDVLQARRHRVHLILPDGRMQGDNLPIQVADAHVVAVEQVDFRNAAAHQRFAHISADTADAEHRYARLMHAVKGTLPDERNRPGKLFHVVHTPALIIAHPGERFKRKSAIDAISGFTCAACEFSSSQSYDFLFC